MTPRRKVALNLTVSIGAIVGALGFVGRSGDHYLHSTFVTVDTFTVYQQAVARQHQLDSMVADRRETLSDSLLAQLYRACQRRGECP